MSRTYFLLLAFSLVFIACKSKKKPSLAGEEPVEVADFIEFFPPVKLAYQFNDTTLQKKDPDSLLISYKVFTQFIPDTALQQIIGKTTKPKIYPMGKVTVPGAETYLFAKVIAGERKSALLFAFDKKDVYMDGMELMKVDALASTQQSASMDKSNSIFKTITRKNADGTFSEGKDVYGLGTDSRRFSLIMTDALDDKITELVNPIDTLSRKFKFAGDYGSGKLNLVSIRDGRKKDRVSFFIHFEKNNGACTGELKGEAMLSGANTAEYREGGDPCVLRFSFSNSSVTLKEMEGCGAHRGLRCAFDGSFAKKKEPKPAKTKPVSRK